MYIDKARRLQSRLYGEIFMTDAITDFVTGSWIESFSSPEYAS